MVELETDKVNVEVPSPAAGVLERIDIQPGGTVGVGTVLGQVKEGAAASAKAEIKPSAKAEPAKRKCQNHRGPATATGMHCRGEKLDLHRDRHWKRRTDPKEDALAAQR